MNPVMISIPFRTPSLRELAIYQIKANKKYPFWEEITNKIKNLSLPFDELRRFWDSFNRKPEMPSEKPPFFEDGRDEPINWGTTHKIAKSLDTSTNKEARKLIERLGMLLEDKELLEEELESAAGNGHLEHVNAIIANPKFSVITGSYIGEALKNAAKNGHLEIVNDIISNPRFVEIPAFYIEEVLANAAENGHLEIVNAIISNPRFNEISESSISEALKNAAENGHLEIVNAIISNPRIDEISA
ncbi:MAG: ankyrin repeat domain-containing protein, partial [Parachlamydiales bacterium]